jgi:hypothetical protein
MARLVKIDMDSGHHQTVKAPDSFKVHDVLVSAEQPNAWVIIPTETGGFFCTRAGTILCLAVEDEEHASGSAA